MDLQQDLGGSSLSQKKIIEDLQKQLSSHASKKKPKKWFEDYLKNQISYRGIKSPQVSKLVSSWAKDNDIANLSVEKQLSIAVKLLSQKYAEDKFAGIFYFQKFLIKKHPFEDLIPSIDTAFRKGYFYDWSTTDWMNVRVLSPLIEIHGLKAIKHFKTWTNADNLWQRRSALVSLRACVKNESWLSHISGTITKSLPSSERFIQTAIGWLIADLSKVNPEAAEKIVERHFKNLSREIIDRHTKYLPNYREYKMRKRKESLG